MDSRRSWKGHAREQVGKQLSHTYWGYFSFFVYKQEGPHSAFLVRDGGLFVAGLFTHSLG